MKLRFFKLSNTFMRRKHKASVLTEFALASPLLMVLLLVTIQYGLILNVKVSLTHLSREGARYASINPGSDNNIKSYIINTVAPPHIRNRLSSSNITITPTNVSERVSGSPITVTIVYNMQHHLFLPSTFLGVRIFNNTVTTSTTMVIE